MRPGAHRRCSGQAVTVPNLAHRLQNCVLKAVPGACGRGGRMPRAGTRLTNARGAAFLPPVLCAAAAWVSRKVLMNMHAGIRKHYLAKKAKTV